MYLDDRACKLRNTPEDDAVVDVGTVFGDGGSGSLLHGSCCNLLRWIAVGSTAGDGNWREIEHEYEK